MTQTQGTRIIVVIGMHRSGTSAITRGLHVLGVELGTRLLPPLADNTKGFWEDADINAFDTELLHFLGHDWHTLAPITRSELEREEIAPFKLRAATLLRRKLHGGRVFGVKDPRIARILPFWQEVFTHVGVDVGYVIAVRHPLSVAGSLKKRDEFDFEKSSYLWLAHVVPSILDSEGRPRVVVDYDRLMTQPDKELGRVAAALSLPFDASSPAFREYVQDFLTEELRHAQFHMDDLKWAPEVPPEVVEAYRLLDQLANDELSVSSARVHDTFVRLNERLHELRPALRHMTQQYGQVARLTHAMAEREGQIARLNQAVADQEGQISRLSQSLAEREGKISWLKQRVSEREGQIAGLTQAVSERDRTIATILRSTSWRLTAPLRMGRAWLPALSARAFKESLNKWQQRATRFRGSLRAASGTSGGLMPLMKRTVAILKAEGWQGVTRRRVNYGHRLDYIAQYNQWLRCHEECTDDTRAIMRAKIKSFAHQPLISVIMPTYNPEPKWLVEAIESVRRQLYPHWELCIADDASPDARVLRTLEPYAAGDSRIKIVCRNANGHISAASNSAVDIATGDFVALLDHDDLLAEHALFWVAEAINRHPEAKLLYSDEDKIDMTGERCDPYFKCDWNPDLFYSHNLITHLGVYQTEVVRAIGGFRVGYEGAQDYDLALRCIERIEPRDIVHIPRVLYHWRMHAGSTAAGMAAKPYALEAGRRAIQEFLDRRGETACVESMPQLGMYRVHYELPDPPPFVSLIIPMRNGLDLIRTCITSVLDKTTYENYEVLIVDNGSDDPGTLAYLDSLKGEARIRVLRDDRPFNFSALNNAAVNQARGSVVGLINNDIEVISPGWLSEMVSHALRPEVGAVGARLLYPNDTLQHGGVILGIRGVAGHAHKGLASDQHGYFCRARLLQSFSAVTAACLVIRKDVYVKVGGFDEDLRVAYNDIDFCLRVREIGYRNIYTPYAELYHHESATRGYEDTPEKQFRLEQEAQFMKKRWGELLINDPAYSPNLTLERQDFSFAWPPRVPQLRTDG
jgi:glycosyltransferase involved in cell wall biosynthesis